MTQSMTSFSRIGAQAKLVSEVEAATSAKLDLAKLTPLAQNQGALATNFHKSVKPQTQTALAANLQKSFKPQTDLASVLQGIKPQPDLASVLQGIKLDPKAKLATMVAANIQKSIKPQTQTALAANLQKSFKPQTDLASVLQGIKLDPKTKLATMVAARNAAKLDLAKLTPLAQNQGALATNFHKSVKPQTQTALAANLQKSFKPQTDLASVLQGIKPQPDLATVLQGIKLDPKAKLATMVAANIQKSIKPQTDLASMLQGIRVAKSPALPKLPKIETPPLIRPEALRNEASEDPEHRSEAASPSVDKLLVVKGDEAEVFNSIFGDEEPSAENRFWFSRLVSGWDLDYLLLACVGVSTWVIAASVQRTGEFSMENLGAALLILLAIRDSQKG